MSDLAELLDEVMALRRELGALKTKFANLIRPGAVTDRDHEKGVRVDLGGGKDGKPNKSDWIKATDISGVTSYLPREGEQGWMISPNGDQQQGGFIPLTHSDEKKNPAPDGDTTVLFNRDDVNISLKDGVLTMTVKKFIVKAGDSTLTIDKDGHTLDGKTITEKSGDNSFKLDGAGHTFKGGKVSHDERNIGSGHVHSGIQKGVAKTEPPDA